LWGCTRSTWWCPPDAPRAVQVPVRIESGGSSTSFNIRVVE
jgi:hypothetical protein